MPNSELLERALARTGTKLEGPWERSVAEHAAGLDLSAVRADVEPFLERREDLALFTRENLAALLES